MGEPERPQGDVPGLYQLLEQLDRFEDLLEEMDELGVASRDEAERRIAELNDEVSQLTGE